MLLPEGEVLLEIKTGGAYPTWLIGLLNGNGIYKTSFSKYGAAYIREQKAKKESVDKEVYAEEKAV